jgi:hypothetical protein
MGMGSKKRDRPGPRGPKLGRTETTRTASDRQESASAVRYGGEVQRGSGATERHKGDVKTTDLLLENKTTQAGSIRIEGKWLTKITKEARNEGRVPAVEIEIRGIEDPLTEQQWVLVPASEFARLIEGE